MPDPFQHVLQLALLAGAGAILALQMAFGSLSTPGPRRALLGVLSVIAALSTGAYFRMGQVHTYGPHGSHMFHYHDIYHYAIGAKYYPELGYERLYACTWVALDELGAEGTKIPSVPQIRDLSEPDLLFNPQQRRDELSEDCHERFTDARWNGLKSDLKRAWLDGGWDNKWWTVMLRDMGFNPPPSWSSVAYPLANVVPLTEFTLELWPFVDLFLIFGVGSALIYWAFGPWALLAYLTVLGSNHIASYRWTGGSFARQLWFAFLIYGVCFLQLKRYASAGVALGLCVAMRMFPIVFAIGAVLVLIREARESAAGRQNLIRFVAGGVAAGLATGLVSLVLFDVSLWPEFFEKMRHHGNTFFTWHVGFKKWATFVPAEMLDPKDYAQAGLTQAEAFQARLNALYDARRWLYDPLRVVAMGAAAVLSWRRSAAQATLIVGGVWMFCLAIPANYYYVYLALIPVVFYAKRADGSSIARILAFFAAMISVSLSPWMGSHNLVQNAWINSSLLAFFAFLVLTLAVDRFTDADQLAPGGHPSK